MADQKRNSGKIVVAAIDFGTTYSGYAYSFKHQFASDPLQIYSNLWMDGKGLFTHKAPTTVLFDTTGSFHSFGYEAEEKYAQLASSDKHIGWRYFRRFKMILHNQSNLTLNTKLRDDQGKRMDAIKIFSAAIHYLKEHMIDKLKESGMNIPEVGHSRPKTNESNFARNEADNDKVLYERSKGHDNGDISNSDILWVLTVPAIWSDSAKQFMRLAAVQAGIPESQLHLALEPEVAAIFSFKFALLRRKFDKRTFKKDFKFMVIDLGGISTAVPFDPTLHSEAHKHYDMCEDVFKVFITIGTDIIPGKTQVKHIFNSAKSNVVEIYKSSVETPAYTTDPCCERIGEIFIDLPADKPALVEVIMLFGDTELHVEAKEYGTENKISAKFKFVR